MKQQPEVTVEEQGNRRYPYCPIDLRTIPRLCRLLDPWVKKVADLAKLCIECGRFSCQITLVHPNKSKVLCLYNDKVITFIIFFMMILSVSLTLQVHSVVLCHMYMQSTCITVCVCVCSMYAQRTNPMGHYMHLCSM